MTENDQTGSILRGLKKAPRDSAVKNIVDTAKEDVQERTLPNPPATSPARKATVKPTPEPAPQQDTPPAQEPAEPVYEPASEPAPVQRAQRPVQFVPDPAPAAEPATLEVEIPRSKMTYYQSAADIARMKATHLHTMALTGHEFQTDFIEEAIIRYCRQLEAAHNDGEPFPVKKPRRRKSST